MQTDSGVRSERSVSLPGRHSEKFADLVRADREKLLTSFAETFSDPRVCAEATVIAANVLDNVVLSVLAGEVRIRDDATWIVAMAGWNACLSPRDSVRAVLIFTDLAFLSFAAYLAEDPELLPCFRVAAQAVHESVRTLMQAIVGVWTARHSQAAHQAQADERRRLARELHDRVGEVLSVGLRRLDLQEIDDPYKERSRESVAREVLVTAMIRLRTVTSDLREAPVTSIEKALQGYLDSLQADAEVELEISGDERVAPPAILDEVFLIIREAVRNALTHGAPQRVRIAVEISGSSLWAEVTDDGHGFDMARVMSRAFPGGGIPAMRERTALMSGQFIISSRPGAGVRVEVSVPLPDQDPTGQLILFRS